MKQVLISIILFLSSLTACCQNNDAKSKSDSTVIQTRDLGVVSKKASQGKYAVLNIYRPKKRGHSFASFTINVNDSAVCKIKNNTRYTIRIYKFGATEIWARSESKSSLTINLEMGKEYYLKCRARSGMWAEVPDLVLMDPAQGKTEFDEAEDDY